MKQSFTFYLTHWVIKLKGLKKLFSEDPINFKKIRKEDVFKPKGSFFKRHIKRRFQVLKTEVTEVRHSDNLNKLIVFVHGGAFISGPAKHHWETIKTIVKATDYTIWLCNYPKAPEHKIIEISENIEAVYDQATKEFDSENIILLGDSVGGTLVTALTQRLIKNNKSLPIQIQLVSPVMDASLSNPDIDRYDVIDPMLSKKGIFSAKKMCAGDVSLKDPIISPIYGSFKGFPETILFLAENDIMYPDGIELKDILQKEEVSFKVIHGENMPHIWPFLPIMKESSISLQQLISLLN
ncbi:alpha/beta hydrolase [Tenacibaculum sp. 190524A05c]|uniref:Alpha/beta hydrolase n=1 Tax=Tenacibaculum platacis TaxID=3137852 RepID=A0ABM9NWZ9_9FLAO